MLQFETLIKYPHMGDSMDSISRYLRKIPCRLSEDILNLNGNYCINPEIAVMFRLFFRTLRYLSGYRNISFEGLDNLPDKQERLVVMPNHTNFSDISVILEVYHARYPDRYTSFPYWLSRGDWPFSYGLSRAGVVPVPRREDIVYCDKSNLSRREQINYLRNILPEFLNDKLQDKSVVMFPEGKWSKGAGICEFPAGMFGLLSRLKNAESVIPIGVNYSQAKSSVKVRIGKSVPWESVLNDKGEYIRNQLGALSNLPIIQNCHSGSTLCRKERKSKLAPDTSP